MSKQGAILVLEGPDCSGKSSLAQMIQKSAELMGYKHLYFHPQYPKQARQDIPGYYLAFLEAAAIAAYGGSVVVMDRAWLSECVYATMLRGGIKWPHYARLFTRLDLRFGVTSVLCLPSDLEAYKERYGVNIDPDHPYEVHEAELVYRGYQECYFDHVPRSKDYFEQAFNPPLIKQGWHHFCTDTQPASKAAVDLLQTALKTRQNLPSWQLNPSMVNWLGNVLEAKYLIVVDRANVPYYQVNSSNYPMFGFQGYYRYLLEALQYLRVPEKLLCWIDLGGDFSLAYIRLAIATNPELQIINLDSSEKAFLANKNPKLLELRHVNIPCPRNWESEPASSIEAYAALLNHVINLED